MGAKKPSTDAKSSEKKPPEPSSGTRKKGTRQTLPEIIADFKTHAAGLEGAALEKEIDGLMDRLIERHLRVVPEAMRAEARKLLRAQLEEDPTLRGMLEDLRAGAKRR